MSNSTLFVLHLFCFPGYDAPPESCSRMMFKTVTHKGQILKFCGANRRHAAYKEKQSTSVMPIDGGRYLRKSGELAYYERHSKIFILAIT